MLGTQTFDIGTFAMSSTQLQFNSSAGSSNCIGKSNIYYYSFTSGNLVITQSNDACGYRLAAVTGTYTH